ncbi:ABC transporter ATP-binding protein [Lewinella sp. W8]|uniref:ABC transporter ATP-binding protein n=1 Tax=Lewinella sp. W8 TaxID=2528208 RepID=UPI00106754EE|nr:ABC transporter ATP-binding protein [Lewinella sp. W8]MTB52042.1 ATP-binding cassette domain-containing protein [Lewinella sp. W8]
MAASLKDLRALIRDNPYKYLLATAWRYAEGMRRRYVLIYLMFIGVNGLISLQPIIFGLFINFLQAGEGNLLRGALIYGGLYMAIIFGFWSLQWPARLMERRMAFELSRRLMLESYDRIVHLPLDWHRRHHSGDTINRARKGYEALRLFFDNGFAYFQTITRMVIALIAIVIFSPIFGGIAVVLGLVILMTVLTFDGPIIEANKAINDRENELMAGLSDNLSNIITVTTLRLGTRTAKRIDERIGRVWPPFLSGTKINERKWFTVSVFTGLMYVSIVIGFVYQNYVPGEVFLVGGLVTLIGYVNQFANQLSSLTAQYNQIIRFRSDLAAIEPIYEAYETLSWQSPEKELRRDWTTLKISNLNFKYEAGGDGIQNVELRLDRGKRIALIGPSGSGKTTTLYTLRGLYPPESIHLHFDEGAPAPGGGELREKSGGQIFEQTTLIPQTPEIFEETFRNNLTMGLPREPAELERAIHLSVLEEVIGNAEAGLDTFLAEGGANLSGGQRQRLSIARGLLAADTSTLLLLDEPTSSLDPQTELLVYERIFEAFPEKTIVSTLHRLHLLRFFDHIYYMEDGKIQAEGDLRTLLRDSDRFRTLYEEQVGV